MDTFNTQRSLLCKYLALAIALTPLANLHGDDGAFKDIFDGETLSGWEGSPDYWRVEDGAIVGEIPEGERLEKNHWLIWKDGEVSDFELRFQFRISGNPRANSGIQFRCQATDINHVSGYQADLDQGATWLGRIYDEHGRKLLVERGTRALIDEQGNRQSEAFANPEMFATLFREGEWNDYRISASGDSVSIEINGTLFSQLVDRQTGERDLSGQLAFQLHSGLHTIAQFRNVRLRELQAGEVEVSVDSGPGDDSQNIGLVPRDQVGRELNLGFEDGTLKDWTVEGDAFNNQPSTPDLLGNDSPNAHGSYLIVGSVETKGDGVGLMSSAPFKVEHSWASLLVGGGAGRYTQVEIVLNDEEQTVLRVFRGRNNNEMRRVYFDLSAHRGSEIFIRLLDENTREGGYINYDDFRFHETQPAELKLAADERVRENPILAHLEKNPHRSTGNGAFTLNSMSLNPGFVAERIVAEPDLHQPIAFTFDEKGRIWAIEAHSYPEKRADGEGIDKIMIFEDQDGDGTFESRKVFMEGLNLASGLEIGYGGVWIGAAPELLFVPDANGDDIPDSEPIILLDGFGYQDTHETLNSFIWGPDGWLYGNQGVFNYASIGKPGSTDAERIPLSAGVWRYHPIHHEFEIFAHGGSNQWGLDFNESGELFMTQCRSRWGGGPTTHIVQGGHYWNQANRGHADFVSGRSRESLSAFPNYLMASARYGHGEGGAGKPGSRAVYGGHSQVGAMIYLGDNWPAEYRNRLFSHNLHGHQLNQQINLPEGSGYNTIHAGRDILYCPDPAYVAVDLKYGPDGAVYFSDWVDTQHCHNPNSEQWDRGNGRLYRLSWAETFQPAKVNLATATDIDLAELQLHANDWHVRMGRRLLHERATNGTIEAKAADRLQEIAFTHSDATRRLRALWAIHAIGGLSDKVALRLLEDDDPYVRAWTIQLMSDEAAPSKRVIDRFKVLAKKDPSPIVRRYLASATQRLPASEQWDILASLSQKDDDANDRYLPQMIWFGLGPLMKEDPERGFKIAQSSAMPLLQQSSNWYAAKLGGASLNQVVSNLSLTDNQESLIDAISLGLEGQTRLPAPKAWFRVSKILYNHENPRVSQQALNLGATFNDSSVYPKMRQALANGSTPKPERINAFSILSHYLDPISVDLLVSLIDDPEFRVHVIRLAPRIDREKFSNTILQRFSNFDQNEKEAVLNAFTQKASLASKLLDNVATGKIDRSFVTAFHARALGDLDHPEVDRKLASIWGSINTTADDARKQIDDWESIYAEAPQWAFRALSGKAHFETLCSTCHQPGPTESTIGPNLTGSGSNGARYFLENILDPNAVVGDDYALSIVRTKSGQTLSGILDGQSESSITLNTLTGPIIVPRPDIASISKSPQSMMPPGLLATLNERETIELLKYLESL